MCEDPTGLLGASGLRLFLVASNVERINLSLIHICTSAVMTPQPMPKMILPFGVMGVVV